LEGGPGVLRAIYFPGAGQKRAMIISGVHGDELAGVEVVETLLPKLKTATQTFMIMVVPRVFAKNSQAERRKTSDRHKDPNRQMPDVGKLPDSAKSAEPENQALLGLIQRFSPERLVSVHGVARNNDLAGITSDPRPRFGAADRQLALDMARAAAAAGGSVPGNKLGTKDETATYPTQSRPHEDGTTLGQWGGAPAGPRPAINMILIETKGKGGTGSKSGFTAKERDALVKAILDVFLN
jgi:Succinylglutamate desuccinylase / Aspartoacylase family